MATNGSKPICCRRNGNDEPLPYGQCQDLAIKRRLSRVQGKTVTCSGCSIRYIWARTPVSPLGVLTPACDFANTVHCTRTNDTRGLARPPDDRSESACRSGIAAWALGSLEPIVTNAALCSNGSFAAIRTVRRFDRFDPVPGRMRKNYVRLSLQSFPRFQLAHLFLHALEICELDGQSLLKTLDLCKSDAPQYL